MNEENMKVGKCPTRGVVDGRARVQVQWWHGYDQALMSAE